MDNNRKANMIKESRGIKFYNSNLLAKSFFALIKNVNESIQDSSASQRGQQHSDVPENQYLGDKDRVIVKPIIDKDITGAYDKFYS